ncbi:hypothetical protein QJS04_geneDACA002137 [Acorus gramineus]|uniref:ARM repeat N-terminal plant domain-containing protein n=1 Tax=Acorus gramineus TaxID=55184 RepID=A0AAV9AAC0_ACOGR|nr:hypothetical protein QJS04_geneDACA002137 [Acorus gramineus]
MAHPDDPEFIELGIFECMAGLIWKGLNDQQWLTHDQNVYIPYYAAHIIGSYTMNMEEFAVRAVQANVIHPLVEILRGRMTWVEHMVAIRALYHLASYDSIFPFVASHEEVLEISIQLASSSLEIVYTLFYKYVDARLSYHRDLLTGGMAGTEMEANKAEEWASQLQCWSLQLINCYALKPEFLPVICMPEFLTELPGMWGGLIHGNSFAGVGFLRTICHHKVGRVAVANFPGIVEALCNISRSSDEWQYTAIEILLLLLQDFRICHKVINTAVPALVDLAEISTLGNHENLGDTIINVLQKCVQRRRRPFPTIHTKELVEEVRNSRQRMESEKNMLNEDLHVNQATAFFIMLEGNALLTSGNSADAAARYSEALALCPMRLREERAILYSNRAQCYILLRQPMEAISDATRALCLHNPLNRDAKSLCRRSQAYDMLGLAKECLLDAVLFVNECYQTNHPYSPLRPHKVLEHAEKLVKKQMDATWLFREAAIKHGGMICQGEAIDTCGEYADHSEWETASGGDDGNDGIEEPTEGGGGWKDDKERSYKSVIFWNLESETMHEDNGLLNMELGGWLILFLSACASSD